MTLTVENDGAPGIGSGTGTGTGTGTAEPGRGSGLAGLRERLGMDGVLRAGPAGSDLFRLTAEVPLPPTGSRNRLRPRNRVARPDPSPTL